MSIRKKAISGFFWTFCQQFATVLFNFLVSVILARLLLPSEFGLIGMISVFIAVGEVLMNGGLANSLIRTENPDQLDYSTVFYVNLVVSIGIYCIVFNAAPFVAVFFKHPVLAGLLRLYMLCIILYAFSAVPATRLTKELNFKRLLVYHVPSLVVGGVTGVVMAYLGFGVWSLVWMNVVQAFLYSAQLWYISRWLPSLIFDRDRLRKHFGFGSRLVLTAVLDRIYNNVYNLVIGSCYSAELLGFYTRANTLVQIPSGNLFEAINKVSYPIFAAIQNENDRLLEAYKKMMHQVLFIITPVLAMMALSAEPLFRLILTVKWTPAVPYFRILCVAAILNTVNGYNLTILLVKGRSDLFLRLNIIEKVFVTLGILASVRLGIYGLLYFQVISSVVIYAMNGYTSGKLIDYPVILQLVSVLHILLIAALATATTWYLDSRSLFGRNDFERIVFMCACYVLVYVGAFILFKAREVRDFSELFRRQFAEKFFLNGAKI
jgi:O-antigen/teichoic acid export membrane protein